jgi:hypothetical protein
MTHLKSDIPIKLRQLLLRDLLWRKSYYEKTDSCEGGTCLCTGRRFVQAEHGHTGGHYVLLSFSSGCMWNRVCCSLWEGKPECKFQ